MIQPYHIYIVAVSPTDALLKIALGEFTHVESKAYDILEELERNKQMHVLRIYKVLFQELPWVRPA